MYMIHCNNYETSLTITEFLISLYTFMLFFNTAWRYTNRVTEYWRVEICPSEGSSHTTLLSQHWEESMYLKFFVYCIVNVKYICTEHCTLSPHNTHALTYRHVLCTTPSQLLPFSQWASTALPVRHSEELESSAGKFSWSRTSNLQEDHPGLTCS